MVDWWGRATTLRGKCANSLDGGAGPTLHGGRMVDWMIGDPQITKRKVVMVNNLK